MTEEERVDAINVLDAECLVVGEARAQGVPDIDERPMKAFARAIEALQIYKPGRVKK